MRIAGRILAYTLIVVLAPLAALAVTRPFAGVTHTYDGAIGHRIYTAEIRVFGETLSLFDGPWVHVYVPLAASLVFLLLIFVPGRIWPRSFIAGAPGRLLMSLFITGLALVPADW